MSDLGVQLLLSEPREYAVSDLGVQLLSESRGVGRVSINPEPAGVWFIREYTSKYAEVAQSTMATDSTLATGMVS